jgi:hypothetical protein
MVSPSARPDEGGSFHLPVQARTRAVQRRLGQAAHGRFEGSAAQTLARQLRALDFANSIILFGASLLLSVLPYIILLSSLANYRIDADLSRHIGLNGEGARIISQLFRSAPAHSAAPVVTALILAVSDSLPAVRPAAAWAAMTSSCAG